MPSEDTEEAVSDPWLLRKEATRTAGGIGVAEGPTNQLLGNSLSHSPFCLNCLGLKSLGMVYTMFVSVF